MPRALPVVSAVAATLLCLASCGEPSRRPRGTVSGGGEGPIGQEGEGEGQEGEGEGEGPVGQEGEGEGGLAVGTVCDRPGVAQDCGAPSGGLCRPGWQWCEEGRWTACEDRRDATTEACDGLDNNCDGVADEIEAGCEPFANGDPDAAAGVLAAQGRINELRTALGVPLVKMHPALNLGAQNHADYFVRNGGGRNPHAETAGQPGFTGTNPGARAAAAGYDGPPSIGEDMAFGVGPVGSVMAWYDSVYHRVPLVDPRTVLMGFGHRSGERAVEVLDVAMSPQQPDVEVLVPYDGQTGVPTGFRSDSEGPDPVPDENTVGYPISIHRASAVDLVGEPELVPDDGEPYELWIADVRAPAPGFLRESVFVMRKGGPMQPNTWHTIRISYRADEGTTTATWRFETGR